MKEGEPLFFIEASEMIQAQNDFMSALALLAPGSEERIVTAQANDLEEAETFFASATWKLAEVRVGHKRT